MVGCLLDTSILVDLLRLYQPARQWIASQSKPGIVTIVALELIEGTENSAALRSVLKLLKDFETVPMDNLDLEWAEESLTKFHLSHNVDAMDCLIAAASHRLQIPLYTRNMKHFTPLIGALARRPY
ncbi:MAG: PIN domain-containing protein [Anaerolineae bacterium]|nr:PIN domain-containing protein [Anaerolineae bacterium]